MKIIISEKARSIYASEVNLGKTGFWNQKWATILTLVAGLTLEVETRHLFRNQFNTAPLDVNTPGLQSNIEKFMAEYGDTEYNRNLIDEALRGICVSGLRIMESSVSEVIDDERPGKARCNWCGQTSLDTGICSHCDNTEYLEVF